MPNDAFAIDLLSRLWEISWQSAVIAGLVFALRLALGRLLGNRWRHMLWALVLCRLLMPVLPASRVSLFSLANYFYRSPSTSVAMEPQSVIKPDPSSAVHISIEYGPVGSVREPDAEKQPAEPLWRRPIAWLAAWLVVAAGLILRLVFINLGFHRALDRKPTDTDTDPRLRALLDACCQQAGMVSRSDNPRLIITDLVDAPAVCGVFRPRLLLPTSLANTLSDVQLRLIFLHELMHIKCNDIAIDWLWAALQSLHWFNPVLWLIAPIRRNDRELARDEMVLSLTGSDQAEWYGRTLLDLAQPARLPLFCPGLVGMFSGRRHLQRRIKMIARFNGRPLMPRWIGAVVLFVAGGCVLTNPGATAAPPATAPSLDVAPATAPTTAPSAGSTTNPTREFLSVMNNQFTDDPNDPDRPSPADAVVLAKLDERMPELRFIGNSLKDVIDFLRDASGLNFYVDWPALQRAGIAKDAPVTARLKDIKLSKALQLIFKSVEGDDDDHKLGYVVDEGVVTISTKKELNKNTVTRGYDVNDLIFVPPDYGGAKDPALTKFVDSAGKSMPVESSEKVRADRIADIRQFITDNVDRLSWKTNGGTVGTIQTSELRAVLLITQTPENQRKIRAALDSLRSSRALQISLETRFIMIDDDAEAKLPAAVQQRLATVHGAGRYRTDEFLTKEEVAEINKSLPPLGAGTYVITAPRLTLFSGQMATVAVSTDQAYVADYKIIPAAAGGKPTYEPVAGTIRGSGLNEKVTVVASPDLTSAFVTMHLEYSLLIGMVDERSPHAPENANLMIQRPLAGYTYRVMDRACAVPDRVILLLACNVDHDPAGAATQPDKVDPITAAMLDRDRHRHAYLLIKPTILRPRPPTSQPPAQFPLSKTPSSQSVSPVVIPPSPK